MLFVLVQCWHDNICYLALNRPEADGEVISFASSLLNDQTLTVRHVALNDFVVLLIYVSSFAKI